MNEKKPLTVLVVDDDEAGLYATGRLLRQVGYRTLEAATGQSALEQARQQPNLIILDVRLPDLLGFDVCRRLKQDATTTSIPILLCSATFVDNQHYITGLEDYGADAYLAEPVDPGVLLATVRALLRSQQAEEALRKIRDELEWRVTERTAALRVSNESLQYEIAERIQAEESARRHATRAEALARAAAILNAQLDLSTVLRTICAVTSEALEVPVVLVYLFQEAEQTFTLAAQQGLPDDWHTAIKPIPKSLYDQYSQEMGAIKCFLNLQNGSDWLAIPVITTLHLHQAMMIDLLRERRPLGCLVVLTDNHKSPFSPEELSLLQGLAHQANQAIVNARLYQEVQINHSQLQRLSHLILKTSEEERKRLSRELHDSIGQMTTALLINLSLLQQEIPPEQEPLVAQVKDMGDLIHKIHQEIRSVSYALRPPELETLGLSEALNDLCQEFARFTRLSVVFECSSPIPRLTDTVAIAFYRFVQEALNNVAKHAQATHIHVLLTYEEGYLRVIVEDNGIGFDVSANTKSAASGLGLMSMQERLKMLGGELAIYSSANKGTRLVASYAVPQV